MVRLPHGSRRGLAGYIVSLTANGDGNFTRHRDHGRTVLTIVTTSPAVNGRDEYDGSTHHNCGCRDRNRSGGNDSIGLNGDDFTLN